MQHCAFIILPHAPFSGLQWDTSKLILWNDLNTEVFLWSALESCLIIKTYTHIQYICTHYIAMFRFLRKRKVWIWCMVYVICTCLYVHTRQVMRNVTISSTMGTLCYELWHTVPFIINILYILYRLFSLGNAWQRM